MKRTSLIVTILVLVSLLFAGLRFLPEARATTLYVGGAGPGNYTTIQAAVDDANPGDTVYVFSGTYNENVIVNKTISLHGENNSTTIIDGGGNGDVILVSANWVNLTGFTVTNSGIWREDAGIEFRNSNNSYVAYDNVSDNFLGIHLYQSNSGTISTNTARSNGFAIHLERSDNNTIINNSLSDNSIGVYLYLADNTTVFGNNIKGGIDSINLRFCQNSTIADNTMLQSSIMIAGGSQKYWITNTIDTSNNVNGKPVYFWKNRVGGRVPFNAGQVILANCTYVTVENQTVNNGSAGIILASSMKNTIVNNTASSNTRYGISLSGSEENFISRNRMASNRHAGIRLEYSFRNIMDNNTVQGNDDKGILLVFASSNRMYSNNVSYNSDGIYVVDYSNNHIVNNSVIMNTNFGIYLNDSTKNRVYHNVLAGNGQQAYDNRNLNEWDNGYPSGGNYWSDYAGIDEKRGILQDKPGKDGMGDTPYVIDLDSKDRYPLLSPLSILLRPPRVTVALLSGNAMENTSIVWSLSPDDGGGIQSVLGYGVYRNSTFDFAALEYDLIGSVPNGTVAFVDQSAGEGDPNDYYYRICAIDLVNYSKCAVNQAAKFTRPLGLGPNLVSIPLIQFDESIETVLQTVEYDKAWYYDSSSQEWKWYMTSKSYRKGLWSVNHTMGLWISVTGPSNLTVAGIVPAQTEIRLSEGWDLVSFPSVNTSYTVADLKVETGVTRVEGLETMPPFPPHFLRVLGDADVLQAGEAYWVRASWDTVWVVEAS